MAPKKRSHAEASSSQPRFDNHRFPSLNKATLFQEQFANRTVESEREIAEELQNKNIFQSLANRNWYSLIKFETKVIYINWVREFYCNLEYDDTSDTLKSFIRGKSISISTTDIAEFLEIPCVTPCDYPIPDESTVQIDYDMIGSILCGAETLWPGGTLSHGSLSEEYRFLNRFVCHNLEPRGHTSDITHKNGYLLFCIGTGKAVNIPQVIFNALVKMLSAKRNSILPFPVFLTEFLLWKAVPKYTTEPTLKIKNPINARTLAQSSAHIHGAVQAAAEHADVAAPAAPGAHAQGEQQQQENVDQIAILREQVQAMHLQMDRRFAAVDGRLDAFDIRFNSIDAGIAEILSRFQNQ